MDSPRARRAVRLPAATVRARTRPGATDADGCALADRVAAEVLDGPDRSRRDAAALAELTDLLGPDGVDEGLVAYPGTPGQVGALGVLARLLEQAGDATAAGEVRRTLAAGHLDDAVRLGLAALGVLRRRHGPGTVTGALADQLAAILTDPPDDPSEGPPGRTRDR